MHSGHSCSVGKSVSRKHCIVMQLQNSDCLCKSVVDMLQVGAYARKYRYLQQDHDEASHRLLVIERLLKQYDCSTSEELLTGVAEAEADLDKWYQMEGQAAAALLAFHCLSISSWGNGYGIMLDC